MTCHMTYSGRFSCKNNFYKAFPHDILKNRRIMNRLRIILWSLTSLMKEMYTRTYSFFDSNNTIVHFHQLVPGPKDKMLFVPWNILEVNLFENISRRFRVSQNKLWNINLGYNYIWKSPKNTIIHLVFLKFVINSIDIKVFWNWPSLTRTGK